MDKSKPYPRVIAANPRRTTFGRTATMLSRRVNRYGQVFVCYDGRDSLQWENIRDLYFPDHPQGYNQPACRN